MEQNRHDALVVIISCYGIQGHIVTSDYKLINKDTIHRIFSVDHPSLRNIPGIFIYDCCDGNNQVTIAKDEPVNLDDDECIIEEQVQLRKVTVPYGTDKEIWFEGDY